MHGVRVAARETLVRTLREFQADRAQVGNADRSEDARRAADDLERGGEVTFFERIFYAVGDPADRWTVTPLPRARLVAELTDAAEGWAHFGKARLAVEAQRGAESVSGGADWVRVGSTVYEVAD